MQIVSQTIYLFIWTVPNIHWRQQGRDKLEVLSAKYGTVWIFRTQEGVEDSLELWDKQICWMFLLKWLDLKQSIWRLKKDWDNILKVIASSFMQTQKANAA